MLILTTKTSLKKFVTGKKLGFVPTMGGLHEGHVSLIKKSQQQNPATVVSIFVNPKQFGPNEDYTAYPRDLSRDRKILEKLGVEALFYPSVNDIYGPNQNNFLTYLGCRELENLYCGKYRPSYFGGVLLVVLKLFNLVEPEHAYFGKKDYQQFFMIKKMVEDLDINIRIHGLPTVRAKGGVALSSRNQYLSPDELNEAQGIYRVLKNAKSWLKENPQATPLLLKSKIIDLFKKEKNFHLQYADIVNRDTLFPAADLRKAVILVAGFLNRVRLIDNLEI